MIQRHVIIDLEFHPISNLYPDEQSIAKNEIIQLGMVVLDQNMNQISTYSTLVKPKYVSKINKKINKLTGINTSDLNDAPSLEEALAKMNCLLKEYGTVRFYSWSDSDLIQLKRECLLKEIPFPSFMGKWLDFQKIFTRLVHSSHVLSLKDAMYFADFDYDQNCAHSAIYDALITADLLKLTHSKEQFAARTKNVRRSFDPSWGKTTLGDIFAQKLEWSYA